MSLGYSEEENKTPPSWAASNSLMLQNITANKFNGPSGKTIITFDGQLYNNALQLKDYRSEFCIRLEELHTVIASLNCLGKFIDGSGIDQAWEEAQIYSSTVTKQIIDGRHIKCGAEAYLMTYLALLFILADKTGLRDNRHVKQYNSSLRNHENMSREQLIEDRNNACKSLTEEK
eukprot:gene2148-2444_t